MAIMEQTGMAEAELATSLEHESALLGSAGTADMRQVVARSAARDEEARLALDVCLHRLRAGIAAMAATPEGSTRSRSPAASARTTQ